MWNNNEIVDDTYMIMQELGRGGTGVIYLAYHMRLQKYVVLKKIKDNFTNVLKVRTEVDILKKLHHTYLPQVYDFMQVDNQIYTVIDYIDGCDLDRYIKAGYTFTEEQLIKWLRQLCDVLDYLHGQKPQILHCDIKPGNIMITQSGDVCLIDFNVSLDEESKSELSGISQYYASPEQYEKAMSIMYHTGSSVKIDQRTDIYSLGATFYHMISGLIPQISVANTPLSQMGLGYSQEFLGIIDKMMEPNKALRFRSTAEVTSALNRAFVKDKAVTRFAAGVISASAVYIALLALGFYMISHGNQLITAENFTKDYGAFENYYKSGDFVGAIDQGIDILNDVEYKAFLDQNGNNKSELLHYIGECYFYEEYYSEACRYYEEAMTTGSGTSEDGILIRDYAISLIRTGNVAQAQSIVADAMSRGLGEEDLSLIEAETLRMQNDYRSAAGIAAQLLDSADKEIAVRAGILAADSYRKLEDYEAQIGILSKLILMDDSLQNQRRLGDAYILYASTIHNNDVVRFDEVYGKARQCYEKIVANEYHSLKDTLNLVIINMELEEFEKAVALLEALPDDESDYTAYMYLTFCYDRLQNYDKARENCRKAVMIYENMPEKDKEPYNSQDIQNLYVLDQKYR